MLQNNGIDLDKHCTDGADGAWFAELLMAYGVVLNDFVVWVTFHGTLFMEGSTTLKLGALWGGPSSCALESKAEESLAEIDPPDSVDRFILLAFFLPFHKWAR